MRRRILLAAGVSIVVAAAVGAVVQREPQRRLVAHFARVVGVYEGSDVRVLGVRIGRVVAVRPEGRTVRVEMRYDRDWDVPADAQAVIVPPSVVSDRYVQLTPAYDGGPALADGAELPVSRTAAPMEIDEIYQALDDFNKALGPEGANADGALSDLLAAGRANLEGNGTELHDTLDGLSRALDALSDGRQDLFGTVGNLQVFTTALARSDQQVRSFNQQLAGVAEQLAGERNELTAALRSLATALADVTTFIKENRTALKSNVDALADVTGILVRQQQAVINILDVAPLALSNLNLAYNPRSGTLDTRDNAMGPYDPASFVCSLMVDLLPAAKVPDKCALLKLPPGAAPAAQVPTQPAPSPAPGGPTTPSDLTLGGILRGTS
ncbi:MCE family protein [Phytohabitans rumicis]|uniref:ABC transporter substrate-binding protein n=1 Tax=Phytohabitans rumicis TaxID=1076125 RepID=A0A6V8LBG6_9ACTN|nr:MCE family protein [Phytohabitans rumicis]GFJ92121.1 ABC transporter substrate-binding protein [Phytohabitans rumicis]